MSIKSIQTKIILWALACIAVTVALLLFYTYVSTNKDRRFIRKNVAEIVNETTLNRLISDAASGASHIQERMGVALYTAHSLAQTFKGIKIENEDGEAMLEIGRSELGGILNSVIEQHRDFVGIYNCWEPYGIDALDDSYKNDMRNGYDATGRFIPYYHWNENKSKIILSPMADYESLAPYPNGVRKGEFYLRARETRQISVVDPFPHEDGIRKKWFISISAPILHQKRFYGVVGVHLDLDFLQEMSLNLKQNLYGGRGQIAIISHLGILAASSEYPRKIGKKIQQVFPGDWRFIRDKTIENQELVSRVDDGNMKVYLPIEFPHTTTNWAILVEVPMETVMAETNALDQTLIASGNKNLLWKIGVSMAGVAVLCFALFGLISFIVVKPLHQTVRVIQKFSRGDLSSRINRKSGDEIGALADALDTMANALENRAVIAHAIALGNLSQEVRLLSENDSLGLAYQIMIDSLNSRAEAAEGIAQGHLDQQIDVGSENDRLGRSFQVMLDNIKEVVRQANVIALGDYSSDIVPRSENDELGKALRKMTLSLRKMARTTEEQNWIKTGQTKLSAILSGEQKIEDLCRHAVTFIAKYMGVQVATLYIKDSDRGDYRLMTSYAFRERKGVSSRCKPGEGLVGQAALEKERILYTDIPNGYIRIESALGSAIPENILVVPLVYEEDVKGVIELGASLALTAAMIEFADLAGDITAVAINAALSNAQMKKLLERTREQSEVLQKQQSALKQANEELEQQTQTLKASEAKLQDQQEELQSSNEELEEKTELLQSQKAEIELKNKNLQESEAKLQDQQEALQASNVELEEKTELLERQKEEIEKKNMGLEKSKKEVEKKAKQLEIATKYKSEFLSNMSHELRTPLNSLLLLARMLSDNEEQNLTADQVESAESIHRSGQTLLRLINDILDLSKIEANKIELNISRLSLNSFIGGFESEFKHMAKDKGLEFRTNMGDGTAETVVTDIQRLEQITRNLLSNAFKFTTAGHVSLSVARPDAGVKVNREDLDMSRAVAISVADTGTGIPEEKQKMIFEAFKQVDGSITRSHGGTGLGLSISKELASLIGGELRVKSRYGEGTVFTLYVPETFSPSPAEPEVEESAPEPATVKPEKHPEETPAPGKAAPADTAATLVGADEKTILIIEDDSEFASILSDFFQKNGYATITAPDGETGIKQVVESKPLAIILDIGLPGIDGWAVLNELKANPETRHIPVHIMSAYDKKGEGLHKGAVGYLTKPVSTEDLRTALVRIEEVLAGKVKELLVVEDDKTLREGILSLMGTNDITATATGTGGEALALLKQKKFDCIILDLGLPDISGFELLDEINRTPSIEKIPVIIYTGRDLTKEETEKLEQLSSSIIIKSAASMERLLDETALFLHRVERELPDSQQEMIRRLRDRESVLVEKTVMIVDDDMRNAFALNRFLKGRGMKVVVAENGAKALEMLERGKKPDIILMDIMMPVMDGYEAMKRIRGNKAFEKLPILALTAKAMESDREACIRSGASDYLSKPVDVTKLLSMLRVWLY